MKTIFAFSDLHYKKLSPQLKSVAAESDYVFFLGDGAVNLEELPLHKGFYGVRGNCDTLPLPKEECLEIEGIKVLLTHGDAYGVKDSLLRLEYHAKEQGCSLAFFGHTHFAEITEADGLTLINPGALGSSFGDASYAYTVITEGRAFTKIVPCRT